MGWPHTQCEWCLGGGDPPLRSFFGEMSSSGLETALYPLSRGIEARHVKAGAGEDAVEDENSGTADLHTTPLPGQGAQAQGDPGGQGYKSWQRSPWVPLSWQRCGV